MTIHHPGRDLNAVIATRIMGGRKTKTPPDYSTDLAAAYEVVGKLLPVLGKNGPQGGTRVGRFTLSESYSEQGGAFFVAQFKTGRKQHPLYFIGSGESAAHAICLAGLKVVDWLNSIPLTTHQMIARCRTARRLYTAVRNSPHGTDERKAARVAMKVHRAECEVCKAGEVGRPVSEDRKVK